MIKFTVLTKVNSTTVRYHYESFSKAKETARCLSKLHKVVRINACIDGQHSGAMFKYDTGHFFTINKGFINVVLNQLNKGANNV
jgi:hypothetical protein